MNYESIGRVTVYEIVGITCVRICDMGTNSRDSFAYPVAGS